MNEIILDPKGNTYIGPIAQRFLFGDLKLPEKFSLGPTDIFDVYQVTEDGRVIHRASQSTRRLAESYMNDYDRVCVYHRYPDPAPIELLEVKNA